jgi:protein-S-isoprenylcysteine O-methyltransferase Ste14
MLAWLRTIGWIACVVYATIPSFWLVIHPRADYWRSRSRSPYRLLLPMWMGMWVICGLVTSPWRHVQLYRASWSWIPAAIIFAAGLWIYKNSGAGFSIRQLGGLPEILEGHHEQRLVTSGIRSYVRHPIYLGHFCEMLAWSAGTGLAVCYGLTAFALITGAIMIRLEDAELEKRFGEEYREYRKKVPAVLPRMKVRFSTAEAVSE